MLRRMKALADDSLTRLMDGRVKPDHDGEMRCVSTHA
jgi:hypothetical protein